MKLALKELKSNKDGIKACVQFAAKAGLLQSSDVAGSVFTSDRYCLSLKELLRMNEHPVGSSRTQDNTVLITAETCFTRRFLCIF